MDWVFLPTSWKPDRLLQEHGPNVSEPQLATSAENLLGTAFVITPHQAREATALPSIEEELSQQPYNKTVPTMGARSVPTRRQRAFQQVLKVSPYLAFAEDELFAAVREKLQQPGLSADELHRDLVMLRFTPDEMQRARVLSAKERWVLASQAQGRKHESMYSSLVPNEAALKGARQSGNRRVREWIRDYTLTPQRAEAVRRSNPEESYQSGNTILNAWKTVYSRPTDHALITLAQNLRPSERAAFILLRGYQWRSDEIAALDPTWSVERVQLASVNALAKVRRFVAPGLDIKKNNGRDQLQSIALMIAQLPPSNVSNP